jgi:hypothetical protein
MYMYRLQIKWEIKKKKKKNIQRAAQNVYTETISKRK